VPKFILFLLIIFVIMVISSLFPFARKAFVSFYDAEWFKAIMFVVSVFGIIGFIFGFLFWYIQTNVVLKEYANFEIMALFKVLFNETNKDNRKLITGKAISYFENDTIENIEKGYNLIVNFILKNLEQRRKIDIKIVNSVLFKSKDFYTSLRKDFIDYLKKTSSIKLNKIKI